jgi:hypothetical protein
MKTTKSDSKKTAPKKGASKSAPAKVESKPKKTSKKSTAKDLPKTEVITEAKPVVAEAPAKVEAAPPKPAPRITEVPIDVLVPGEAINGIHLARCIRYAAKVTPREEGELYFTHDESGRPLISGHDTRRSHTGFIVDGAAFHCDIAVPREDACELASMLEGLSGPMVRIDRSGRVTIHHGAAQPPAIFLLGERAIVLAWQPPSQEWRTAARGPLRLSASAQAAAVKWPAAVVHEFQSSDGIAWFNVSDSETGVLLARAVIAQDGKDLHPEDQRQTEIFGARTAPGASDGGVKKAVDDLKKAIPAGTSLSIVVPGKEPVTLEGTGAVRDEELPASGAVTIEANGETVTIEGAVPLRGAALDGALGDLERWAADANASGVVAAETVPAPAFPEPDTKDVVISIPTVVWDELSPDALEKLHLPPGVTSTLSWFTGQTHTETAVLTADSARAVGRVCEELGLVCADVTAGRRYGIECTVWTVGRAAPKGGA